MWCEGVSRKKEERMVIVSEIDEDICVFVGMRKGKGRMGLRDKEEKKEKGREEKKKSKNEENKKE